ncbi:sensor histidine kinase [Mesorhizobium sp. 10J20-29]
MRSRLFLKIYLTLLASLVIVAVGSALLMRIGQDDEDRGWAGRRDRFIADMLPAGDDPVVLSATLDRLSDALDADIAVYGPDRRLIAAAGSSPPPPLDRPRREARREGRRGFATELADGRYVALRSDQPLGPGRRNPLGSLVLVAAVIGIAAYPVVRQLTRRLESLRKGVEVWGGGDLSRRVPVSGSDEVAAVAKSFNEAAGQIERLVAAHRSLLANASHELRSPLARLRMAIDLYERSASDRTRDEIIKNLGELDALVEEILLASRLDHVRSPERVEDVDLLALTAEEGAGSDVAVTGSPATVSGDARLLRRLVRNLIQNALRHGAPPVTTHVRRDGPVVRLVVRDCGDGIPEGERDRIFEPFYRPSGRSESAGGWGIGLSLVRQIAVHHGGSVRYEMVPEGGACFVVELPANGAQTDA